MNIERYEITLQQLNIEILRHCPPRETITDTENRRPLSLRILADRGKKEKGKEATTIHARA